MSEGLPQGLGSLKSLCSSVSPEDTASEGGQSQLSRFPSNAASSFFPLQERASHQPLCHGGQALKERATLSPPTIR